MNRTYAGLLTALDLVTQSASATEIVVPGLEDAAILANDGSPGTAATVDFAVAHNIVMELTAKRMKVSRGEAAIMYSPLERRNSRPY